jgi:hypothetical protein
MALSVFSSLVWIVSHPAICPNNGRLSPSNISNIRIFCHS